MSKQTGEVYNLGSRTGITSAAPLATPAYGSATNDLFPSTDGNRVARSMLIEVEGAGAGSGNIAVTLHRGNPTTKNVTIADDLKLAGTYVMAYAGAAQKRSFVVDTDGCDIGVSVVVSAINITATIKASALNFDMVG